MDHIAGKWIQVLLIILASFTNLALLAGGLNSFGVFQPHLVDFFEATVAGVAWAATFSAASLYIFGIFSGILIDRFGVSRVMFAGGIFSFCGMFAMVFATDILQLTIFIGVVLGFGQSMLINAVISSLSYMFCSKKFDLYIGITLCGYSFGTMVCSVLTEVLIQSYGLHGAYLFLAGLMLNECVCTLFIHYQCKKKQLHRSSSEKNLVEDEDELVGLELNLNGSSILRKISSVTKFRELKAIPGMFIFIVVLAISEGACQAKIPYIVPKAIDNGIDPMAAATGFSIFGFSAIAGRLLQLLVNAFTNCNAMSTFFFALCLNCVSNILLSLTTQYSWYILALIIDGVSYGLLLPYTIIITRQLSGHRLLAVAFGWATTLMGVIAVIWGVLNGSFYDIFDSYQEVFLFCSVLEFISLILILISRPLREMIQSQCLF